MLVDVLPQLKHSEPIQPALDVISLDGNLDLHARIIHCLRDRTDHLTTWRGSKELLLNLCQAGEPQVWRNQRIGGVEIGILLPIRSAEFRIPVIQRYRVELLQFIKKTDPRFSEVCRLMSDGSRN